MPAPTLTVVVDSSNRRCVITVTTAIGDTITVYRSSASGVAAVRGIVDFDTVSTSTIFSDYELPQGVVVSYFVIGDGGQSAPVVAGTFNFGGDVVFDLANPRAGMVLNVESFPSENYDVPQDIIAVWDREDPIVVSGMRKLPSGTLTLITLTLEEAAGLRSILRTGNIIAFSPAKPEYGIDSPAYYSVGPVAMDRYSPLAKAPERKWALSVQQVAAPSSAYVPPLGTYTWGDVKADGALWGDYLTDNWAEVSGF